MIRKAGNHIRAILGIKLLILRLQHLQQTKLSDISYKL